MADFRIDADIIARYAAKVDDAAGRLETAAASVDDQALADVFGGSAGVGESYSRAAAVLRRQLVDGNVALLSVSGALRKVVAHHGGRDSEHADLITRAGEC